MTKTTQLLTKMGLTLMLAGLGAIPMAPALAAERAPVRHLPDRAQQREAARVIVQYKTGASVLRTQTLATGSSAGPQAAAALGRRLNLTLANGRALGARTQVLRASGIGAQALVDRLSQDADVEWAAIDHRRYAYAAPNDPLYPSGQVSGNTPAVGQWYLRGNVGPVKSAIAVEPAWDITPGSASIVVAVLDTGVRFEHPDLAGRLLPGYDFVGYSDDASVATANDGNLDDTDPSDPGDWITAAEDASGEFEGCGESDSSWHGTQVAGLIGAATNNGIGMAGIARGVRMLPVRVLGKCGGFDSDIITAMRWSAGFTVSGVTTNPNPARVLNLSLGSDGSCTSAYSSVMTELVAAGVTVVAAAGNDGLAVGVPANCGGVVAVAGVRHTGTKVGYSNLGPEVTVAAPAGNCVNETGPCLYPMLTTVNTGTTTPVASTYTDSENITVGTSFATPVVAGTVGLMLSVNPALTPADVRSMLRSTARGFPTTGADAGVTACRAPDGVAQDGECYCTTRTCGAGLTDAGAAVATASAAANGLVAQIVHTPSSPIAGDEVTLDAGSTQVGAGRVIVSYEWALPAGGSIAGFVGPTNAAMATLVTTGTGTLTIRLTVVDDAGNRSITIHDVAVAASGLVAAIGSTPPTLQGGDSAVLDASGSDVDSGRTIVAYLWEMTTGSGIASFTTATNAVTAGVTTTGTGTLSVRLTLTDSAGQQASTTRTYAVTSATPTASFTATPTAPDAGESVALDASGSIVGTNRTLATYLWQITSGGNVAAFSGATNAATATLATSGAGPVTVKLTITDNRGAQAETSRTLTISAASSGGGGGGAMSPWWALGLLLAAAAMGRRSRHG